MGRTGEMGQRYCVKKARPGMETFSFRLHRSMSDELDARGIMQLNGPTVRELNLRQTDGHQWTIYHQM
ncbi:hypothetical protein BGW80DRAFT_1347774 [Lactifluus volemus]|nr:hypothetical protein BGW80DRAFT_1347774 [Lactifluus volemus]